MNQLKRLETYGSRVDDFKFNSNLGIDDMVTLLEEICIGHGWHKRDYDYIYGQMDYGTIVEIKQKLPVEGKTNTYQFKLHTYCNTEELMEMQRKVPKIIANLEKMAISYKDYNPK